MNQNLFILIGGVSVPVLWLFILPANFILIWTSLSISFQIAEFENPKKQSRKFLLPTLGMTFLSQIIAFAVLYIPKIDVGSSDIAAWFYEYIAGPILYRPTSSIYAMIYIAICISIGFVLIYFLNLKFVFKDIKISEKLKSNMARNIAIITSPYIFLASNIFLPR